MLLTSHRLCRKVIDNTNLFLSLHGDFFNLQNRKLVFRTAQSFPYSQMEIKKTKLMKVNRRGQEEHPRKNLSLDKNAPKINEDDITQVSKETEGMLTKKKLSKSCTGTKSKMLGVLSQPH